MKSAKIREIRRDEKGYYSGIWDGKKIKYPSVTTALKIINDFSMVAPDIMKLASNFGTAVHWMINLFEKETLDYSKLDPALVPILAAWKHAKNNLGIRVKKTEVQVVSDKYRYAGTLDIIADVGFGKNISRGIIEIKSRSSYNKKSDPLQTAAYVRAYNESYPENKVNKRWFCGFDLDGGYRFFEIKRELGEPDHLEIFLSVLATYKWRELK
jgi:hypothetical protein